VQERGEIKPMGLSVRRYSVLSDYQRVSRFLRDHFGRCYENGNWTQCRWEYAHVHGHFNHRLTHRFGIWEDDGEMVGLACYETQPGECYLSAHPDYADLKIEMLDYAEQELCRTENGTRKLAAYAFEQESGLLEALKERGYQQEWTESNNVYFYENGFPDCPLPDGFSLISQEDENDLRKINAALWRGFNHEGPPDGDLDGLAHMHNAPGYRKDLTIMVKAPNGDYACYCGMWLDGVNHFAYLEPLATVPEYRKMGLGKAAVTEAMRRTRQAGATHCFGGGTEFYNRIGFKTVRQSERWSRQWA
jgi:predicted N-acetyltransferase YhbS